MSCIYHLTMPKISPLGTSLIERADYHARNENEWVDRMDDDIKWLVNRYKGGVNRKKSDNCMHRVEDLAQRTDSLLTRFYQYRTYEVVKLLYAGLYRYDFYLCP